MKEANAAPLNEFKQDMTTQMDQTFITYLSDMRNHILSNVISIMDTTMGKIFAHQTLASIPTTSMAHTVTPNSKQGNSSPCHTAAGPSSIEQSSAVGAGGK
eukprot:11917562-Ditylum_brightwellii.AAC.1